MEQNDFNTASETGIKLDKDLLLKAIAELKMPTIIIRDEIRYNKFEDKMRLERIKGMTW